MVETPSYYHEIKHHSELLDDKHLLSYPYLEGVERTFLFKDPKVIKEVYTNLKKNPHFETNVHIDDKVIIIQQSPISNDRLENEDTKRRIDEHSHYNITDFTNYVLYLTYSNHVHIAEHLSTTNYTKIIFYILIFMILIIALVYYLIKTERINVENLKASISSIQKSITDTVSGNK